MYFPGGHRCPREFVDIRKKRRGIFSCLRGHHENAPMPLTDAAIRAAKPKERSYRLFDGGGLYEVLMRVGREKHDPGLGMAEYADWADRQQECVQTGIVVIFNL